MKTYLPNLKTGDTAEGIVHEQLEGGDLIIGFHGDLLRVTNATRRAFSSGERVALIVASVDPLGFRLREKNGRSSRPGRFDKMI